MIKGESGNTPAGVSKRISGYLGLTALFFAISLVTLYFVHRFFSGGTIRIPEEFFSLPVFAGLVMLLVLYFLMDGLRLYSVIRAVGFRISFTYILRLVFVNIFISNVTPLAIGGGFMQVFFMCRKGMPAGEATAATSIRTLLAALVLFILTPIIIWFEPQEFSMFFHPNILYAITVISCLYLAFFWVVLFRIRLIKFLIFHVLYGLHTVKILSRKRFRSVFVKISRELRSFSGGFIRFFQGSPGWAALSVLFTALFLLLLFSFSIVLIRILGYSIPALTILAFQVVVTFFMYFAPTPGAAGIAEGGYGLLFAQLVRQNDITMLTLLWRFLTIYIGVFIGILIIYLELYRGEKEKKHET
ncbi:lysylphosphatidylglycerol synthase transmembrane domain-containing protein [Marispirochaeta aestuarii]|uniref:lysylphosphatidylglycerol synthase transmembrane domain-containing protein n=1 Tax=Marispirochaeta aestuarii TaxID=1963862 RepID=UPI0029C75B77|nr:lysylphosphatidylglycerol synthase transmembrane domain-containing protein [Marispirochaeta aestuarii]